MQVFAKTYTSLSLTHSGYIAGSGEGIVTAQGVRSARKIYLLDAKTLALVRVATSLDSGNYLIAGLDPSRKYIVMGRDYKGVLEPYVWDNRVPATNRTIDEQQAMWAGWQI